MNKFWYNVLAAVAIVILAVIVLTVAPGCGHKPKVDASDLKVPDKTARIQVIEQGIYPNEYMENGNDYYTIFKDTKTGKEYLLIEYYGEIEVTPLQ